MLKAKSVSRRLGSTHPFSKGTHNQKYVLSSDIKAEVSRSVGLIYIDNKPAGTGFRVGKMYIVTCAHVIEDVITGKSQLVSMYLFEDSKQLKYTIEGACKIQFPKSKFITRCKAEENWLA